jgi:hypothetical protein
LFKGHWIITSYSEGAALQFQNLGRSTLYHLTAILSLTLLLTSCHRGQEKKTQQPESLPYSSAKPVFRNVSNAQSPPPAFANDSSAGKTGEKRVQKKKPEPKAVYRNGEDPEFASQCGWPV